MIMKNSNSDPYIPKGSFSTYSKLYYQSVDIVEYMQIYAEEQRGLE